MSRSQSAAFGIDHLTDAEIESGTSILLTGEDTDAIESVFYRLLAAEDNERSIVLATDDDGRSVTRAFDGIESGLSDRVEILTCDGPSHSDAVTAIEDLTDLTATGMTFSTVVANAQQETPRFRAGIFLASSICGAVDDTRSVYRFLNSNFLTELRRGDGLGVCAIDTGADIGSSTSSIVTGLETSFTGRIDIADSGLTGTTLETSGIDGLPETIETNL
jgi:hypothetical protein